MELKLGDKIRLRRKQLGLTLKDVAGDMVTAAQISAVEKGKCRPSNGLLKYISDKLNVDLDYFVLSEEERCKKQFEVDRVRTEELYDNKKLDDAVKSIKLYAEKLDMLSDEQRGFYYLILGEKQYSKHEFEDAFAEYLKSLTFYLRTNKADKIMYLYIKCGSSLKYTHKYRIASGYYKNAIEYCKHKEYEYLICAEYNLILCNICSDETTDIEMLIQEFERDINEVASSFRSDALGYVSMIRGIHKYNNNEFEGALEEFKKAFVEFSKSRYVVGMGRAKNRAAKCLVKLERFDEAEEYLKEAIRYKNEVHDPTLIEAYIALSKLYESKGYVDKALGVIDEAEGNLMAEDIGNEIAAILCAKFECFMARGDFDRAEMCAYMVLDCIEKTNNKEERLKLYIRMAEMYDKKGDAESRLEYLSEAAKLLL